MINEEKFNHAKPVDLFNELSEGEKAEAELMAGIAMAIHDKRTAMSMTQQEFADLNHVSQTMVSKWESGEYNFTISNLSRILAVLGIEITLQDKKEPAPASESLPAGTSKWEAASIGGTAFSSYRAAASPSPI